jgi:cytosine/adenosine deaminase-related metal-dependent hydrolase
MPFSDDWASDELLKGVKRVADEQETGLTFHHVNRPESVERTLRDYGKHPTVHLEDIGILGPNVLLAHVLELADDEILSMARTGATAVVCPPAFLKLAQGGIAHSKLPELLDQGIAVAFGTDSANNGNLIETEHAMHIGALVYKDARDSTSVLLAEQVLEMGTIIGAKALGMDDQIGSLEPGKKADIVLFDTRRAEWATLHNPVNALVYNADGRSVDSVFVDGNLVIESGKPTFVDEGALVDRMQAMSEALLERAGLSPQMRWPIE